MIGFEVADRDESSWGYRQAGGPAVIISFSAGAVITVTVMWALAEMAVEHPGGGFFRLVCGNVCASLGGLCRALYVLAVPRSCDRQRSSGGSIYCNIWFPHAPAWVWIAGFSVAILMSTHRSVEKFRRLRILVRDDQGGNHCGVPDPWGRCCCSDWASRGLDWPTTRRMAGFSPHGWSGVGLGVDMAIFSFLGLEILGGTAGEAAESGS